MPKNRLPELQKLHELEEGRGNIDKNSIKDKVKDKSTKQPKKMKKNEEDVRKIRGEIHEIVENTSRCEVILNDSKFRSLQDKNDELKSIFHQSEDLAKTILQTLKQLNVETTATVDSESSSVAAHRIMRMQYLTMHREFSEAIEAHYACMERHKHVQKDMLKQIARTVNAKLDDDALEELLEKDALGQLFTDDYANDLKQAKLNLEDIKVRHQELISIEEHIREIRDIFISIAMNVELQQDNLNRVEYYATKVSDHVDTAAEQLLTAERKKIKKKKVWVVVVIVAVVFITIACIIF